MQTVFLVASWPLFDEAHTVFLVASWPPFHKLATSKTWSLPQHGHFQNMVTSTTWPAGHFSTKHIPCFWWPAGHPSTNWPLPKHGHFHNMATSKTWSLPQHGHFQNMVTSTTWPAGHPSTTWPAGHSSTTLSHPRGTHSVDSLNVSHCPTWQYTYSLTCHCIYTAVAASRDTTLTLARANAAALRSLPRVEVLSLSHVLLQLHCIHCLTWQ